LDLVIDKLDDMLEDAGKDKNSTEEGCKYRTGPADSIDADWGM
jgi:hypothetical protein